MVMTRGKDDPKELWDLLGTKEYRKEQPSFRLYHIPLPLTTILSLASRILL